MELLVIEQKIELIIENLMGFYTQGEFVEDVEGAKVSFFERSGSLNNVESDSYEEKMLQFSHWYLFSRKLNKSQERPIDNCFNHSGYKMDPDLKSWHEQLRDQMHSIFQVLKFSSNAMIVRNLLTKEKLSILYEGPRDGFNKKDIFETRLIQYQGQFLFTGCFCFHPKVAEKFIGKELKLIKKRSEEERAQAQKDLIFKLYKMKNKHEHFRHVPLEMIYTNNPQIKV